MMVTAIAGKRSPLGESFIVLAGVGVETIRFYEREGLIAVPPRATFGYWHYPHETVARIRFIKRAKALSDAVHVLFPLKSLTL